MLHSLLALDKKANHPLRPRLPTLFIDRGELANVMSVTQRMRAAIFHVRLPVIVDRVALQPRQNPDCIGCLGPATLVGKVVGESLVLAPEPVQLPVDVQPCFIKVHQPFLGTASA